MIEAPCAMKRLIMRTAREILRVSASGRSTRQRGVAVGIASGSVVSCLQRPAPRIPSEIDASTTSMRKICAIRTFMKTFTWEEHLDDR